MELTVGYVAGAIAAGYYVATQLSALAIVLILSWKLSDNSSAATLTAAGTSLLGSHWTWLVNSDSNFSGAVSRSVIWLTRLSLLTAGLLAVGSVVTPLGLYSTLQPSNPTEMRMINADDPSPFGYGTPPSSNYWWSRICNTCVETDNCRQIPCPSTDDVMIETQFPNGTVLYDIPYGLTTSVPRKLVDVFSSGIKAANATISNFFDIKWRMWKIETRSNSDGAAYSVSDSRRVDSILLNNALQAVEGLVVDSKQGSIGFRKHSVPVSKDMRHDDSDDDADDDDDGEDGKNGHHGVYWDEDLLFVEPETVCVDTNLTLEATVGILYGSTGIQNETLWLTDRGGFVNLDWAHEPKPNLTNPRVNADLYGRAYTAAWNHNVLVATYFNITNPDIEGGPRRFAYLNSTMNMTIPVSIGPNGYMGGIDVLRFSRYFGNYLLPPLVGAGTWHKNPFHVSWADSSIYWDCTGQRPNHTVDVNDIIVACGQMRPVSQRVSPGSPLLYDNGSIWSQSIYSCASAVKASVKTVSFSYNRTDGAFDTLQVNSTRDRNDYNLLWGVEDVGKSYTSSGLNPIWGIVDDKYADRDKYPNISTVRSPWVYLPGFVDQNATKGIYGTFGSARYLPGADLSLAGLLTTYSVDEPTNTDNSFTGGFDYSGSTNMAMYSLWQNQTKNAADDARIPNIIFTDVVTSLLVGTKSSNGSIVTVTPLKTSIKYHIPYGIPAFIGGLFLLCILTVSAIALATGGTSIQRIRRQLNDLAPGRIYSLFLYHDENNARNLSASSVEGGPDQAETLFSVLRLRSQDWHKSLGDKLIDLSGRVLSVDCRSIDY